MSCNGPLKGYLKVFSGCNTDEVVKQPKTGAVEITGVPTERQSPQKAWVGENMPCIEVISTEDK